MRRLNFRPSLSRISRPSASRLHASFCSCVLVQTPCHQLLCQPGFEVSRRLVPSSAEVMPTAGPLSQTYVDLGKACVGFPCNIANSQRCRCRSCKPRPCAVARTNNNNSKFPQSAAHNCIGVFRIAPTLLSHSISALVPASAKVPL
jgi:hypothetical protein